MPAMPAEPFESVVAQLHSSDWLVHGIAIRKLLHHLDRASEVLDRLFDLTFDDRAPPRSDSFALIVRLGQGVVPWLLARLNDEEPHRRMRAIQLIAAFHNAPSFRLIDQWLPERNPTLPDWSGCHGEVEAAMIRALQDPDLNVRFAAASACEEFGWSLTKTVPLFLEALHGDDEHLQNWAALRLGRLGPRAAIAIERLRALTDSANRYVRFSSRNAIQRISLT